MKRYFIYRCILQIFGNHFRDGKFRSLRWAQDGAPAHRSEDGVPAHRSEDGAPAHRSEDGASEDGVPAHRSVDGAPAHRSEDGAPAHRSEDGAPAHRSEDGAPAHRSEDGAPAHRSVDRAQAYRSVDVRDWLLEFFFHDHIIALGHETEWSPRSPDLTPCDYFLWGYLKSKVYITPQSIGDLEQRIRQG